LDVALDGLLAWMRAAEARHGIRFIDASRCPLLATWLQCFGELDATKAVMPDISALVEYANMREAKATVAAVESSN
jgi:glutathione S-transferase